jgi:hypothetical protein
MKIITGINPIHPTFRKLFSFVCMCLILFLFSCENKQNNEPNNEEPPDNEEPPKHEFAFVVKHQYELSELTGIGHSVLMDADNDGDLDALITHNKVHLLENDGAGYFRYGTADKLGPQEIMLNNTTDLDKADFNSDAKQDLFIAESGLDADPFPGGRSKILIQSSNGKMLDETEGRLPDKLSFTHSATVGDIDGDKDIDIYMGNVAGGTMPPCFYINNGSGKFSPALKRLPRILTHRDELDLKYTSGLLIDVDNDGDLDLIGGLHGGYPKNNPFYERDDILLNDGFGYFSFADDDAMPPRYKSPSWGTMEIVPADLNKDGLEDLLLAVNLNYSETRIQLLLNNGNGTFSDKTENIPQNWPVGSWENQTWVRWIFPSDFNNDGSVDFIAHGANIKPHLFINKGNGVFQDDTQMLNLPEPVGDSFIVILPGDLDNDGDIDLFVTRGITVSVYLNQLK